MNFFYFFVSEFFKNVKKLPFLTWFFEREKSDKRLRLLKKIDNYFKVLPNIYISFIKILYFTIHPIVRESFTNFSTENEEYLEWVSKNNLFKVIVYLF